MKRLGAGGVCVRVLKGDSGRERTQQEVSLNSYEESRKCTGLFLQDI